MKKKIIIFTSSGGNGHVSAMLALQSYLQAEYSIEPVFIFEQVFKKVDPIAFITFGFVIGEDVYNFFFRRKWYKLLNLLYRIGHWYFSLQTKRMVNILQNYLAHEKPDCVISVVPLINGIILQATHNGTLPFLLIPTDMDVTTFVRDIKNATHAQFHMTLGLDDPLVWSPVDKVSISRQKVTIAGLPLRTDFFESKDKDALKEEFNIPSGKPVILLIMGGQGNTSLKSFTKQLATLDFPVHLIVCVGKDGSLKKQLEAISFKPHISHTILGFTQRIADLLAISDLLVTKSGSVSFWEGIYMNIPMILDATCTLLYWEKLNHTLLKKHHLGSCLERTQDLKDAVTQLLNTPLYNQVKKNLESIPKKRVDLAIKPLLHQILN